MIPLSGATAIAGVGATEFSKDSGRSELQLALEASLAALADAGIAPEEVDGLVTFELDTSPQTDMIRNLGLGDVTFLSLTPFGGGGACTVVQHAALAVATGVAKTVLCYRAFNERSGQRFGTGQVHKVKSVPTTQDINWGWNAPHGLMTPAGLVAIPARRYLHDYGATTEDFGRVSVLARAHAATNPRAWFYGKPITLEDHQASRWIVDPLRLLDCCQESDGGVALVVTSADRARDLKPKPALIKAAAQGSARGQDVMTSWTRPEIAGLPEMGLVGDQLWSQSGLTRDDMDAIILYDHFTPYVLTQLEALGFCKPGEAGALLASGALALDGRWPLNPHGGLLGEGYIHGVNGIMEAVRQVRGEAANQISGARNVIVTAGTGVPTSGLIIGTE